MAVGEVLELRRFPVKSFAGERLDALDLDACGVPGDRAHAVWLKGGKRVTARLLPQMLRWGARYDAPVDGTVPAPVLTAPDGSEHRWGEAGLDGRLSEALGRDVALVAGDGGMQDVAATVLVTVESTRARLEDELGRPVDIRRFRPNIHIALDAEPFAELGWEGRRLRIGDGAGGAELELLAACVRCTIVSRDPDTAEAVPRVLTHIVRNHDASFGIYGRPLTRATIRVGDPVRLV